MMISKNDRYGAQRVFLDQVSALRLLGNFVIVAGRGTSGHVTDSVRAMGIEYHGIPMNRTKDLFYLAKLVRKKNVDIIHTFLDRADYLGILLSVLTRKPVVSTMNVKRYHIGYKIADRVITVSGKQQELLISKGVKPSKIRVIRPGIDVERFSRPDSRKRESWKQKLKAAEYSIIFCHISNMLPQKRHAVSLELVAECRKKGERPLLIIAGDPVSGEYYESLMRQIKDLGLENNVCFTGWTSDLPELLSLTNFTLLPSVHEALGMVLVEGMAAGTPIVAREGEGGAEVIEEYQTGFLYEPTESISVLAEKILGVWRDKTSFSELSNKCTKTAQEEFSLLRFGQRLLNVYGEVFS